MNTRSDILFNAPDADFPELSGRSSVIACCAGMAGILLSIVLGRSYAFYFGFLVFAIVMTLVWRKSPRPWIFLVSIAAATPIAVFKQQFTCNLIYAFLFAVLNLRYLARLPRWMYPLCGLAVCGLMVSSVNWISDDAPIRSVMRQGAFAFNFLLSTFVLLPLIYCRMEKSRDTVANLQGLLFCLIIPSTLILLSAKLFGNVANSWEASQHAGSLPDGFLLYKLGRVLVNFLRTEVGFILAALICSSAAVTVSQITFKYRLLGGMCLAANVFLLLVTGSFGSGFACLSGLTAIFFIQFRTANVTKVLMSLGVVCCMLLLTFWLLPPNMKNYLGKRYEHRVVNADTDRVALWVRGINYYFDHPLGVGFTLKAGDTQKTVIHNDYLAFTVSYSLLGGVAYTSLVLGLLFSFIRKRTSQVTGDPFAMAVYLAGLGVIIVIALNSITDHMAENRWYFNLIWSVVWYSYFCSRAAPSTNGPEAGRAVAEVTPQNRPYIVIRNNSPQ